MRESGRLLTSRKLMPINLGIALALAVGVYVPTHQAQSRIDHSNLAALQRQVRIQGREGLTGDPDAATALARKGKEGPIRSAEGLAYYQRAFPLAAIPANAYPDAIQQAKAAPGWAFGNAFTFQPLGPDNAPNANDPNPKTGIATAVSGRDTAIAVVPSTCSSAGCGTIYLGTANGGVWKTTNGGQSWAALTDGLPSLAVGAITLDPKNPNIVYVGTGEPNFSCDSQAGNGIFRSVDGGATWTQLGYSQFVNRSISAIIVDPRTAGTTGATLYVSSSSAVNNNSSTESCDYATAPYQPALGVYISRNGGQTWTLSRPAGVTDGAQSLVLDPANPDVLYGGFTFDGLFRSTNDGATWTALTGGLPSPKSVNFDRITVAVAPSNDKVLYASYDVYGASGGAQVLFRSADGGATWTQKANTPDACDGQCWYDMPLAVDPTNPNVVYAGGSANYGYIFQEDPTCYALVPLAQECNAVMMKTTDGGDTWADVAENGNGGPLHPDDHFILLAPGYPSVIYDANDGGVARSLDGGQTWIDLNNGINSLQFQGLAVGPTGEIFAGTQDNGTFMYTGSTTWPHVNGGDGGPTATDPTNPSISYNSYYGAQLFRNDHNGNPNTDTWIAPFYGDYFIQGGGQFYEPYQVAPSQPNDIFYGTYRIWRSRLRGGIDGNNDGDATNDPSDTSDWQPISFDLSCAAQPSDPTKMCGGAIASVAVSPTDPNVVAVGTSNGQIWLTSNALATVRTDTSCDPRTAPGNYSPCNYLSGVQWKRIDTGLPGRYPTSIHFGPRSSTTIYVTFSGFDEATPGHPGHLFVSYTQGASWTNLTAVTPGAPGFPDIPVNDVAISPAHNFLYVAADLYVYVTFNKGLTWYRFTRNLPSVPVYQLAMSGTTLYAATHGRGIWKATVF